MAKLAAWLSAAAAASLLQGTASACIDLAGIWYQKSPKQNPEPLGQADFVQNLCEFTFYLPGGYVLNGTVRGRNASLFYMEAEYYTTSVAEDEREMSWSWGDTYQRDCPGGVSGDYDVNGLRMGIEQHQCTLWLDRRDGSAPEAATIGAGLGIFKNDSQIGKLVSGLSLEWEGLGLSRLVATPCLDVNMFQPDAVGGGHCIGDETGDTSKQEWCLIMGCHWEEYSEGDLCHCSQDACERNGFSWEFTTCSDAQSWINEDFDLTFDSVYPSTTSAEAGGEVSGVYDQCFADDSRLLHELSYWGRTCCRDMTSICDVRGGLPQTPCLSPANFNPEAMLEGHCSGDETDDRSKQEWCLNMDCHWADDNEGDLCHCDSQDLCERNGFTWELRTCAEGATWLPPIPNFYGSGAMDECKRDDQDFLGLVHYLGYHCCNGKPSVCDAPAAASKCVKIPRHSYEEVMAKGWVVDHCD